jgi:hypothetical protein
LIGPFLYRCPSRPALAAPGASRLRRFHQGPAIGRYPEAFGPGSTEGRRRRPEEERRFESAEGKCQRCGRPHLVRVRCLPDGRWYDDQARTWRDRRGRMARWPDLVEATRFRMTRVVLAAAHMDCDPTNNRLNNLRALCQRCHMLHDRPHHLAQRWITYRRRPAVGDLFLGNYPALIAATRSKGLVDQLACA